jgi:elongation factor Ts
MMNLSNFVKDIAMQIAASNPQYIKREEIAAEVYNRKRKRNICEFRH